MRLSSALLLLTLLLVAATPASAQTVSELEEEIGRLKTRGLEASAADFGTLLDRYAAARSGIDGPVDSLGVANDLCADAITLSCDQTISGTTIGAIFDNVGTCGTSNTAPGVWYEITGTGGPITLSTCNQASYDTKISVFDGTCGGLNCVAGQDDAPNCGGFTTELTFQSTSGVDYFVLVHGFGSATGTFDLSVTCTIPVELTSFGVD